MNEWIEIAAEHANSICHTSFVEKKIGFAITQMQRNMVWKQSMVIGAKNMRKESDNLQSAKCVTVNDLIKLLDKEENKRGGSTGKERMLSIKMNGGFLGYIASAKLDGWGDGLITDVCLELETDMRSDAD